MGHNGNGGFQIMQVVVCPQCGKKFPTGKKKPQTICGYCRRGTPRVSKRKGVGPSLLAEYKVWRAMMNRCYNPEHDKYHRYGGRGITVCERWRDSFDAFFADMGNRPSSKHRIERRNNHGHYEPGNCHWATQKEQMRNTVANRVIKIGGASRSLAEWAEIYGTPYKRVHDRIVKHGWEPLAALTTPARRRSENVEKKK